MRHLSTDGFVSFIRQHSQAQVLDVRFAYERESSGHLRGDHHVPWYTPDWEPNPAFLDLVLQHLSADDYVLVICRSGQCSHEAATLLENSGFQHVYNVLGGYKELRENDATDNVANRSGASLHYQEGMQNEQV